MVQQEGSRPQIPEETRRYIEEEERIRYAIRSKLEAKTREEMALRAAHTQWARTGFSIMIWNLLLMILAAGPAVGAFMAGNLLAGFFAAASGLVLIFGGFALLGFLIWVFNATGARP